MLIHLCYFLDRCLYAFAFVMLFLGVASFSQLVHWLLGREVCMLIAVQIRTNSLKLIVTFIISSFIAVKAL